MLGRLFVNAKPGTHTQEKRWIGQTQASIVSLAHKCEIILHVLNSLQGVSVVAQQVKNQSSIHEDAGSIPGLAQWVKNLVLPQAVE